MVDQPPPIEVDVRDGFLSRGLGWIGVGPAAGATVTLTPPAGSPDPAVTVSLPALRVWRASNFDLWQTGTRDRIEGMAGIRELVERLKDFVGPAKALTLTTIKGDRTADLIPWEMLSDVLQWPPSTAERFWPVRLVEGQFAWSQTDFGEQMRLLLVVGHEGPSAAFDPKDQRDRIVAALKELSTDTLQTFASGVDIPTLFLAEQTREAWTSMFHAVRPHIVIYLGHGEGGDAPAVRFGPGTRDWIALDAFVALACRACVMPPFWVFLACSLGEAASGDNLVAGPEAFRVLAKNGALAMLAMRARIRIELAQIVAKSLIENLAGGESIECAAATARRAAREIRRQSNPDLCDWAAPAVWSAGHPAPKLTWGRGEPESTAWLCAQLLRKATRNPVLGLKPPADWAVNTAARWKGLRRVVLQHARGPNDADFNAQIGAVLAAAQHRGAAAILIDPPPPGSYAMRLRDWAAKVFLYLGPASHETSVAGALNLLSNDPMEGLEQLLALPDAFIVFTASPGPSKQDEPIWDALEASEAAIIVCREPGTQLMEGWTPDTLARMAPQDIEALLSRKLRSLALLSVLDRPISLVAVAAITSEDPAELANAAILIDAPGSGVVLTAQARDIVLRSLDEEQTRRAHEDYLRGRDRGQSLIDARDDLEDLRHLVGAGKWDAVAAATGEIVALRCRDWQAVHWLELEQVLEPAQPAYPMIDRAILLEIAENLVQRQHLTLAALWLSRIDCVSPLDEARRLALLSEVYKAQATPEARDKMWKCAQGAIDLCRSADLSPAERERARRQLREHEQSFARLQLYFKHDAVAARKQFETMLVGLEPEVEIDPGSAGTFIAVSRNLAECLFEFYPFRTNAADGDLAEQTLDRAARLAERHQLKYLGAELAYSWAKLAETRLQFPNARDQLELCQKLALESQHTVCYRVAGVRRYRFGVTHLGEAFDYDSFAARLRPLEFLEWHAWAARYAAQSRLWAAHFIADGDKIHAQALLQRNLAVFCEPIELFSGADRYLFAHSVAGLAVIDGGGKAAKDWANFLALGWSAAWLAGAASQDPVEIFAEIK